MSRTPFHASHCDVWDLPPPPEADARLAHVEPGDEAMQRYRSGVRPVYETLARVMAQLSGLFLLRLTGGGRALQLDHPMFGVACDQLAAGRDDLRALAVPAAATRHHAALSLMAGHLAAAAQAMDRLAASRGAAPDEDGKRGVLRQLHAAQGLLIAAAEPDAGITPIDFSHACCSCGSAVRLKAAR
ncbi:hypothetical protein [Jiella sonneratiae]|uniref:Uncharacterized protein n=1 Tax=Jiella sonneratiae TaxID=2816856 RepID=A0ABS3J4X4_9HYPH|nr:hypothetical protein [Jiella sonneratiae]MBO0904724.1 hypothetical protein [Jiella sonneratiae]